MGIIIFDMDDTLYSSSDLKEAYRQVAYLFIEKSKKLSHQDAKQLYQHTFDSIVKRDGYQPQNWKIVEELNLNWNEWAQECIDNLDPQQYLKRDDQLIEALKRLKENYTLALLTNNNRIQTDRIMKVLGISNLFDLTLTVTETGYKKPDTRPFLQMIDELQCLPEQCTMVGDDVGFDLLPAQSLQMNTILVSSVADVYELPANLL